MANLWRTQRPRFPQYISDGKGRDYYIKFNNAGYWEDQFKIIKNPEYDYPKYNNYHSLFHQAAPVKYIPTGNGRETYIINSGGLYHDQKPLASFKLDDFLRAPKTVEKSPKFDRKKNYLSISEKKYNNKLLTLEKQLVNRLYKLPMRNKKIRNKKKLEDENLLPNLDSKNGNSINNHYASDSNIFNKGERLNTVDCINNNSDKFKKYFIYGNDDNKKNNKIIFKKKLDRILKQSQKIEKYELRNHSRRNNNQTDYNIYKNGRIGCRFNNSKTLVSSWSENFNNINRIKTEGNYTINIGKANKTFKNNKLTFSLGESSDRKTFKTLEN